MGSGPLELETAYGISPFEWYPVGSVKWPLERCFVTETGKPYQPQFPKSQALMYLRIIPGTSRESNSKYCQFNSLIRSLL